MVIAGVGCAVIAGAAHRELLDEVLETYTVNGLLLELVKIRKIPLADGETQVTETSRKQKKILERDSTVRFTLQKSGKNKANNRTRSQVKCLFSSLSFDQKTAGDGTKIA